MYSITLFIQDGNISCVLFGKSHLVEDFFDLPT